MPNCPPLLWKQERPLEEIKITTVMHLSLQRYLQFFRNSFGKCLCFFFICFELQCTKLKPSLTLLKVSNGDNEEEQEIVDDLANEGDADASDMKQKEKEEEVRLKQSIIQIRLLKNNFERSSFPLSRSLEYKATCKTLYLKQKVVMTILITELILNDELHWVITHKECTLLTAAQGILDKLID